MKGSCLCGACIFEISGRIGSVGKCYCSKCRKVSGTGSNAVLWVRPKNFSWIAGADKSNCYSVPDSNWQNVFCQDCGSPLPKLNDEGTTWMVPAGLIDGNLDVGIRGHIWVSSKPEWEVIGDDAPQFANGF